MRIKFPFKYPWIKILVQDPLGAAAPIYETDPLLPGTHIVVNKDKEIIKIENQEKATLDFFNLDSLEEFESLLTNCIKSGWSSHGETINDFIEIHTKYNVLTDTYASNILCSTKDKDSLVIEKFKADYNVCLSPHVEQGEAYILPEPEFLGVLADNKGDTAPYGIGILNPKAIWKFKFPLN